MRGHYWSLMKRGMYMDIKLFDSELKVMDVIWREGDTPAKEIARFFLPSSAANSLSAEPS